ncbi:Transcription initiation factor IIB 4 protein, partial [Halorhabdus tiamatea SARL4B]
MSDTTLRSHERTNQRETTTEEETETHVCPECGGDLVTDSERGETVCAECGLVVEEDEIDPGPEWRAFDAKEK